MGPTDCGDGIYRADKAPLIDRIGRKRLPIGDDGFSCAARRSVVIDRTMLIAYVLGSGNTATLFCRPRRFAKTLDMTMTRAFFEAEPLGAGNAALLEGTDVWEAQEGCCCSHLGSYPHGVREHAHRKGQHVVGHPRCPLRCLCGGVRPP